MEDSINKIKSYLSFKLGVETFASNVSKVLNILEMQEITKVPKAPNYVLGVINLRGKVLPVIDTHLKFGMEPIQITPSTCILVMDVIVENKSVMVGALVDAVEEVLEIDDKNIQESPTIGSKYRTEFILGMIESGENFIMLLDMDMVFSLVDIEELSKNMLVPEKTETAK
ncbi:MAG: chemotaxis protein CheW [Salinivirgaceae bacterium]|nr:chemotaxis protein CheW [Salinivirgaceae bacterium]